MAGVSQTTLDKGEIAWVRPQYKFANADFKYMGPNETYKAYLSLNEIPDLINCGKAKGLAWKYERENYATPEDEERALIVSCYPPYEESSNMD